MTDYIILQPIHLGSGPLGEARKAALERWAAEEKCFWNNEPSIGRLIKKLADERIAEMIQEMLKTMLEMGAVESEDRETVVGLIGADLSEDLPLIADTISDPEDYDGAQSYIDAVRGK